MEKFEISNFKSQTKAGLSSEENSILKFEISNLKFFPAPVFFPLRA